MPSLSAYLRDKLGGCAGADCGWRCRPRLECVLPAKPHTYCATANCGNPLHRRQKRARQPPGPWRLQPVTNTERTETVRAQGLRWKTTNAIWRSDYARHAPGADEER